MEKSSNRRFGVRTVAAIVAGLMVGGMCTAMTASAADDSAAGYSATAPVNLTRPATVPSMDGWTDGTGAWTLGERCTGRACAEPGIRADQVHRRGHQGRDRFSDGQRHLAHVGCIEEGRTG